MAARLLVPRGSFHAFRRFCACTALRIAPPFPHAQPFCLPLSSLIAASLFTASACFAAASVTSLFHLRRRPDRLCPPPLCCILLKRSQIKAAEKTTGLFAASPSSPLPRTSLYRPPPETSLSSHVRYHFSRPHRPVSAAPRLSQRYRFFIFPMLSDGQKRSQKNHDCHKTIMVFSVTSACWLQRNYRPRIPKNT